jgi:hypothetical protein
MQPKIVAYCRYCQEGLSVPDREASQEPGAGAYAADYPVREYVAAMAVELASMARWDGDETLASALEVAADMARKETSASSA